MSEQFMIKSNARKASVDREILTIDEMKQCASLSEVIRKCAAKDKNLSCGTIARFVSKYYHKTVSTNHVYNVLHTQLKRK